MSGLSEPWTVRSGFGGPLIEDANGHTKYPQQHTIRIVECINACAGMDDPQAEIERLRAIEKAAADIKPAYDEYMAGYDIDHRVLSHPIDRLVAALARFESEDES